MKIAIFHDFIIEKGGGTKYIETLSKYFNVEVFTCFYRENRNSPNLEGIKIINDNSLFYNLEIKNKFIKIAKTVLFFSNKLKRYSYYINKNFDVAIFSGFYSIYFSKYVKIPKIYYIQAEPLLMALNREGTKSTEKIILKPIIKKIYKLEKSYLSNMDLIVANSKYTKNIYNNFFNLDVEYIVYPPVNTEKFHFKSIGDFYLYVGRLYLCKRVDVIIRAFMKLRNEKLVIVGEGPLREYIIKVTQKYKNISYLGAVSEKVLKELYANANSVIYITEKEPFGLVPVESNASGKSAIVSNEGGLKEIINKKEVGLRINKPYLKNLVKVIKRKEHLDYWDKKECIRNAKRFDERNFIKQMKKIFEEVNKK